MRLIRHKIDTIPFAPSRHQGEVITPELVILHDTAGRLEAGNSAGYLRDNPAQVSVHFVIERDGSIVQLVPTNRRANHAGASNYHGRAGCNGFSIGIEIVNPGVMTWAHKAAGAARSWWGQLFRDDGGRIAERVTPEHGHGVWMAHTQEQIDAVLELLEALFAGIPTLKDIRGHWYVSPGRKVDPNPLFPMEAVRARILGHDDPAELQAAAASDPEPTASMLVIRTAGSGLNMRRWPSFNPNIITSIPDGTIVPALRRGVFDGRPWVLVLYDGHEGWIVESYTKPA